MDKQDIKEELVVEQLPQVPQSEVVTQDGKKYSLLTRDEALTEILRIVKKLESKL